MIRQMSRGRTNRRSSRETTEGDRETKQGESRGCASDLLNPKRGDKADAEKEKHMNNIQVERTAMNKLERQLAEHFSYMLAVANARIKELGGETVEIADFPLEHN